LDFTLKSHPAYGKLQELAKEQNSNIHQSMSRAHLLKLWLTLLGSIAGDAKDPERGSWR
jgi:hypothetical protein